MSENDLIQVACYLTRRQHKQLKTLTARTHVPISVLLRQAVDVILKEQGKGSAK